MRLRSAALSNRLASLTPGRAAIFATVAAFTTYFSVYAFRKPFSVARFDGEDFLGTHVTLKTAFVISQLLGYTLSKYLSVRICPSLRRDQRLIWLIGLVAFAWGALGIFALVPALRVAAIFANGLPLGMIWGIVITYVEGRRHSEAIMAGLSVSFIVASGIVKDVGAAVIRGGVSEGAMPFVTGGLFVLPLLVSAWLLEHTPEPTDEDIAERATRSPMDASERAAFFKRFLPGLLLLAVAYFFLTALRDFRDNYAAEMLVELGEAHRTAGFSTLELPASVGVVIAFGALSWVRDNRRGLIALFAVMGAGMLTVGAAALAMSNDAIGGFTWLGVTGLGAYLAYVPFASMLFERVMAVTRAAGTAVFAAQLADSVGYTGSVAIALYKDVGQPTALRTAFFADFCLLTGFGGAALLAAACVYFLRSAE